MLTLRTLFQSAVMSLVITSASYAQEGVKTFQASTLESYQTSSNGVAISSELFNLSGVAKDIEANGPAIFFAPTDTTWEDTPSLAFADLTSPENQSYLKELLSCQIVRTEDLSNAFSTMSMQAAGTYVLDTLGGCSVNATWNNGSLSLTNEAGANIGMISATSRDNSGFIFRSTPTSEWSSVLASSSSPSILITASSQQVLPPGLDLSETFKAYRIFAGPTQYPPKDYAAYGIIAFPIKASSIEERQRHETICRAYVESLKVSFGLPLPKAEQMVTVWPVSEDSLATQLTHSNTNTVCPIAVEQYNLQAGQNAIKAANNRGLGLSSIGPFLIGWAPTQGQQSKIMAIDLKNVANATQAGQVMLKWISDIEQSPEVWREGWDLEIIRLTVQQWVDKTGILVLSYFTDGKP